jgi:uncharacterized protein YndB with AHSA1/START domain
MPQPFEIVQEMDVDATPEEVWDAIATGPGMDSWFLGHTEIEPRQGGEVRWTLRPGRGGETMVSTVTTWNPPSRIVTSGAEIQDGSRHDFDYTVTEREGGRTNIRYVHSGMLGGDWEAEYEAMQEGDPMYFFKLAQYLHHFKGRVAVTVDRFGPVVRDPDQVMAAYRRALGLGDDVAVGNRVSLMPDGVAPIEGEIDCVSQHFIGVLSDEAIYRFIHGLTGATMVGHHFFAEDANKRELEGDWQAWLDRSFARADGASG